MGYKGAVWGEFCFCSSLSLIDFSQQLQTHPFIFSVDFVVDFHDDVKMCSGLILC